MENLTQLKDTLKTLQNEMRTLVASGQALLANQAATPAQLTEHTGKINALQARIDLTRATISQEEAGQQTALPAQAATKGGRVVAMRKSNEYAQAFAYAIRNRLNPANPCPDPSLNVLYDVLTESGGTPAGSDGGFLVPDDVQTQINERLRQLNPLRDLFTVEPTSTSKGTRIVDTDPTTGLTQLDGEAPAAGVPEDDQPSFAPVNYSLNTYGLIVPVSRELAADETAKPISENFTMAMCEYAWTSFNANAKWIEMTAQGKPGDPRFHPTQKPIALYTWILQHYAKPGYRILDTHVGSASSLIACHRAGLPFVGFELDATYYALAKERLDAEMAQMRLC